MSSVLPTTCTRCTFRSSSAMTTGAVWADFDDGGAGSYFGPAGIVPGAETTAFATSWVYMDADARFDVEAITLQSGDVLLLLTDGVTEALSTEKKE